MSNESYWSRILFTVIVLGIFAFLAAQSFLPGLAAWVGNLFLAAGICVVVWVYDLGEQRRRRWMRLVWACEALGLAVLAGGYYWG